MEAWEKFFKDGTTEIGSDEAIENQLASWSRGRLDDIISVSIFNDNCGVSIAFPDTNWHQFDRFIAFLGDSGQQQNRIARIIQAEIKQNHVGKYIIIKDTTSMSMIELQDEKADFKIVDFHVSKWLTAVLYIDNRIGIYISDRGRFYEHHQILKQHP
jgi:hypothetical protein